MKEIVYQASRKIEVIEESEYKGVKYAILNLGTHPTAYVENIVNAKDYNDEKLDNVEVHGGFTYCDVNHWSGKSGNYLGWDYAHCCDFCGYYNADDGILYHLKKWTYEEILLEVQYVIRQLLKKLREEEK